MAMQVAQLQAVISADTSSAQSGILGLIGMLGPGGTFAAAAAAGAAAIAGLGVASVKMAGDFQSGMTSLVTGAGESEANLQQVSDGILNLANVTGTSTDQLTSGMYMIESAGYHGAAGLAVLKAAAEGAKVGNADLGTVADATTTLMTDFGISSANSATAVNALVATVANGKTHMQDLSQSLSTIAPTAASAKVGMGDMLGAMATMTGEGVPAANAATYLRQMIISLDAPSKTATKALADIGLKGSDVAAEMQKSLPDALQMIQTHLAQTYTVGSPQYVEALKNISGGSRQMQGMLDLTGTHLQTFGDNVNKVKGAVNQGGNSITGWDKVQQDFNTRIDMGKEHLQTMMITIGTALIPVVENVTDWFGKWGGVVMGVAGVITLFFLPAIIKSGVEATIAGTKIIATYVKSIITAGVEGYQAAGKIAILIAQWIVQQAQAIATGVATMAGIVASLVASGVAAVATGISFLVGLLPAIIASTVGFIGMAVAVIAATWPFIAIAAAIAALVAIVIWAWNNVGWFHDAVVAIASFFAGQFHNAILGAQLILGKLGDFINGPLGSAFTFFKQGIQEDIDIIGAIIGKIGDFLGLLGQAKDAVGGALGGVLSHIPGFAGGTSDAPGGFAMVGESGPELMYVPTHARIYPNGTGPSVAGSQSGGGTSSGGRGISIGAVHVYGDDADSTARAVISELNWQQSLYG